MMENTENRTKATNYDSDDPEIIEAYRSLMTIANGGREK